MDKHINLLRKLAWSFHDSTGIEWDDLFQEAALAYLESLENYDPEKGQISTYLWHCVSSRLKDYTFKERKWQNPLCDLSEAKGKVVSYTSFWDYIPEELKEVVELIIKQPEVFDQLEPVDARRMVRALLFKEGKSLQEVRYTLLSLCRSFR